MGLRELSAVPEAERLEILTNDLSWVDFFLKVVIRFVHFDMFCIFLSIGKIGSFRSEVDFSRKRNQMVRAYETYQILRPENLSYKISSTTWPVCMQQSHRTMFLETQLWRLKLCSIVEAH